MLTNERARLRILMTIFSMSYIGISGYYVIQVVTDLHCMLPEECVRFEDLVLNVICAFFCDIIPIGVLYF